MARAGCQEPLRREPARGPQHDVKPAASTYLQFESRAADHTVKAMSTAPRSGGVGAVGLGGVWGAARVHGDERNTRDPSAQPGSGQRGSYKPMAKSSGGAAGVRGGSSTDERRVAERGRREGPLQWSYRRRKDARGQDRYQLPRWASVHCQSAPIATPTVGRGQAASGHRRRHAYRVWRADLLWAARWRVRLPGSA